MSAVQSPPLGKMTLDQILNGLICSIQNVKFPFVSCRQGHAIAVVGKKGYMFGGSSGSGYGEYHTGGNEPVYLNDLFVLKGTCPFQSGGRIFPHIPSVPLTNPKLWVPESLI